MASAVATPLEKQFSTIAGIDNMTSTSGLGSLQHHDPVHARPQHRRRRAGRSGDDRQDAQEPAAGHHSAVVPEGESRPTSRSSSTAFTSDADADLAARRVRRDVHGAAHLDDAGRGAGERVRLGEVRGAHPARSERAGAAADRHRRSGGRDQRRRTSICRRACSTARTRRTRCRRTASSQDAASFRRLVVTYRNGAPVHLGDLGQVLDDVQNNNVDRPGSRGTRGVILAIQRQPGTNTVAVADAVQGDR